MTKLDATRDKRGTFYAPGNWREKLKQLTHALNAEFGRVFSDNGNSFDSSFQLVGSHPDLELELRVKIYAKTICQLQSESVMKAVGMNTKAIFYPTMRMQRKL